MQNLVLTREPGETIIIDGPSRVTVVRVDGKQVRLAIEAEPDVLVLRSELLDRERGSEQQ